MALPKTKITIELIDDHHKSVERHALKNGRTTKEQAETFVIEGLMAEDAKEAGEQTSDDPDNEDSRRKPRPPLPPAATAREIAEIQNQVNFLFSEGRFGEAKDLQKVSNAYFASPSHAKQTAASLEQQRSSLVDSIARAGQRLIGK